MLKLGDQIFDENFAHEVEELDPKRKFNLCLFLAHEGEKVIGFKFGYELTSSKYYSWLGGVDPEFRGQGVATKLMDAQHEWCKKQAYEVIQTKTKNKFRSMLLLNIRYGFDITGTFINQKGDFKIILEKKL